MPTHPHTVPYPEYISRLIPVPTPVRPGGALRTPLRCILFDIYGTLFISGSGDIGTAMGQEARIGLLESLIRRYHLNASPDRLREAFFEEVDKRHQKMKNQGVDVPEVAYDTIWASVLPELDPEVIRDFAVEYELIVNPVYPMPNLKPLLAGCRSRNLTLGIVSNAQFFTPLLFQWFLGDLPEALGFDPNLLFYSYRYGVAKPSPVLFGAAAAAVEEHGMETSEVLVIGNDMLNDIYPGQRAGFQTALFAGDARSLRLREDSSVCKGLSPDLVVTDLSQLLDHLATLNGG